jgi:hypothetical protein
VYVPPNPILAIDREPLPQVTPVSPLIPERSVAESANQFGNSVSLPTTESSTNYNGSPVSGPPPASPLITPPTILTPQPGHPLPQDEPLNQAIMARPKKTPARWDEPNSAYGTPNPPDALNYYESPMLHRNSDLQPQSVEPSGMEVIVLKNQKEFTGKVLQRGPNWSIELPNGSIMNIPGDRVQALRKQVPVPTSAPNPRQVEFPETTM